MTYPSLHVRCAKAADCPAAISIDSITYKRCQQPIPAAQMAKYLFDHLPKPTILGAYARSPGNELNGKLESPESSAALVANTFGYFIEGASNLPPIPGTYDLGWPAIRVVVEECMRLPWHGGTHPWLDAVVETETHMIGVESKRYEPFRTKKASEFSEAYRRDVWGERMKPYETMREALSNDSIRFERLDAAQLVKHALRLRTQAKKRCKSAALLYLYAEPHAWPYGTPVTAAARAAHADEIEKFARQVAGAEVAFRSCSYTELLASMLDCGDVQVARHAEMVAGTFQP